MYTTKMNIGHKISKTPSSIREFFTLFFMKVSYCGFRCLHKNLGKSDETILYLHTPEIASRQTTFLLMGIISYFYNLVDDK